MARESTRLIIFGSYFLAGQELPGSHSDLAESVLSLPDYWFNCSIRGTSRNGWEEVPKLETENSECNSLSFFYFIFFFVSVEV